jgi:recombination protein RecT
MTDTAAAEQITKKAAHPVVVLRGYLQDRVDSLRSALPPHIKPERFISSVMTAVQINPDLLACDKRSLFIACMRSAQDGLFPDGTEAAIVPYKDKATYIAMYQGLLKKFRNSGDFKWITAGIAYEGEEYSHWIDETGEHFKHVPSAEGAERDPKKIKRVYAVATTLSGGFFLSDMTIAEINKRRAMSRASRDDAPWKIWTEEMMKKTALRNLSKLLPKSSDIDALLQRDEQESLGVETTAAISDQRSEAFGSALDHFAESGQPTGEQGTSAAPASASGNSGDASANDASAAAAAETTKTEAPVDPAALAEAHKRGKEAKDAGTSRKAVPAEYRDEARGKEGLAWLAGYDGGPVPVFGN